MERALKYTYSIFRRLSRYHLDGRYKLDNNLIENSIRGMVDNPEQADPPNPDLDLDVFSLKFD
jgi:hypothetical protein